MVHAKVLGSPTLLEGLLEAAPLLVPLRPSPNLHTVLVGSRSRQARQNEGGKNIFSGKDSGQMILPQAQPAWKLSKKISTRSPPEKQET